MMSVAITEIVHCGPWGGDTTCPSSAQGSADKVARLLARLCSEVEAMGATFERREINGVSDGRGASKIATVES
jgi:hypothetical protein